MSGIEIVFENEYELLVFETAMIESSDMIDCREMDYGDVTDREREFQLVHTEIGDRAQRFRAATEEYPVTLTIRGQGQDARLEAVSMIASLIEQRAIAERVGVPDGHEKAVVIDTLSALAEQVNEQCEIDVISGVHIEFPYGEDGK